VVLLATKENNMAEEVRTKPTNIQDYITLNEGDSSYHFLFDENPSLMFIVSYDRRFQDVNKKCCETLGYKKSDLIGKDPLDIINPLSRPKITSIIDRIFNKENVGDTETELITADGRLKRVLFSHGRLIEYKKSFCILLSGVDLTENRKNFEEFEKTNELFTRFINLVPAAVFIKDERNICIFRNKVLTETFNPDIVNSIPSEVNIPGLSLTRYLNLKDKENNNRYCEVTTFKVKNTNQDEYTGGIIIDHTEKVETENARKENESVLKILFENSSAGILLTDLKGYILNCNSRIIKMTGYSGNLLKQLNIKDITPPEDFPSENVIIEKVIEGNSNKPLKLAKHFTDISGNIIRTKSTLNIIKSELELPKYLLLIVSEIL
jgi:PAS domain S-box-containing protein